MIIIGSRRNDQEDGLRLAPTPRDGRSGLFQTTELVPLLEERGVRLSREQVFRLVTQRPQRLSMETLAALCDILDCQVQDLIEITVVNEQVRKTGTAPAEKAQVRRSTIRRPEGL